MFGDVMDKRDNLFDEVEKLKDVNTVLVCTVVFLLGLIVLILTWR